MAPVALAVAVLCLLGTARAWQYWSTVRAARGDEQRGGYAVAAVGFARAAELAGRLSLRGAHDECVLAHARMLSMAGQPAAANALLGLAPDSSRALGPADWEGQTGAELHRNVSCWADLWLWEGVVSVELQVRANAARGTWPQLAVTLDGQPLGLIEANSAAVVGYTVGGQARAGLQRLEVSLVNGFWTDRGEHRWARLEQVTVRCRGLAP